MSIEGFEGIQPEERFHLPESLDELHEACLMRSFISPHVRLAPGQRMTDVFRYERSQAAGKYGFELLHRHEVIAVSGFLIEEDHLTITHTPQGVKRDQLSHAAFGKLLKHDFRSRIIKKYPRLATSLKLDYIVGLGAKNHPKVKHKNIDLERGEEIIDDVFERNGYEVGEDGNFYLYLTSGAEKGTSTSLLDPLYYSSIVS